MPRYFQLLIFSTFFVFLDHSGFALLPMCPTTVGVKYRRMNIQTHMHRLLLHILLFSLHESHRSATLYNTLHISIYLGCGCM